MKWGIFAGLLMAFLLTLFLDNGQREIGNHPNRHQNLVHKESMALPLTMVSIHKQTSSIESGGEQLNGMIYEFTMFSTSKIDPEICRNLEVKVEPKGGLASYLGKTKVAGAFHLKEASSKGYKYLFSYSSIYTEGDYSSKFQHFEPRFNLSIQFNNQAFRVPTKRGVDAS